MTRDKKYHFAAGVLTAMVVGLPCCGNLWAGLWAALSSGILVGLCKEWCDKVYTGKWDIKDFVATAGGAAAVAVSIVALHIVKLI
jgi:hypothetical protein